METGSAFHLFCLSSCCNLDSKLAQAITWLCGEQVKMGPLGRRTNSRRGTGSWPMGDFGGRRRAGRLPGVREAVVAAARLARTSSAGFAGAGRSCDREASHSTLAMS
jgi:hypothetical protein